MSVYFCLPACFCTLLSACLFPFSLPPSLSLSLPLSLLSFLPANLPPSLLSFLPANLPPVSVKQYVTCFRLSDWRWPPLHVVQFQDFCALCRQSWCKWGGSRKHCSRKVLESPSRREDTYLKVCGTGKSREVKREGGREGEVSLVL